MPKACWYCQTGGCSAKGKDVDPEGCNEFIPAAQGSGEAAKVLGDAITLGNQVIYDLVVNMRLAAETHTRELVAMLEKLSTPPEIPGSCTIGSSTNNAGE